MKPALNLARLHRVHDVKDSIVESRDNVLQFSPLTEDGDAVLMSPRTGVIAVVKGRNMADDGKGPTFAELAAAMKTLQQNDPPGIGRHISTIVVGAALGLGAWLMSSVNSVQTSVTQVGATVVSMQKTVDSMSARTEIRDENLGELKTKIATIDQRLTEVERRGGNNDQANNPGK